VVVELVDDPHGVPNSTVLYRRTTWDKIGGKRGEPGTDFWGLTPNFFTDAPPHEAARLGFARVSMSVGVAALLDGEPEKMLAGFPDMGLASITAEYLRNLKKGDGTPCPQGIMLAPTASEPWHAVVFDLTDEKRSGAAMKAICKASTVVIPLIV